LFEGPGWARRTKAFRTHIDLTVCEIQKARPIWNGLRAAETAAWQFAGDLTADAEALNDLYVPFGTAGLQVIQQPAAARYEYEQSAAAVVILLVGLEVIGQQHDSLAQQGNLYFRRAGVRLMDTVRRDYLGFLFSHQ